MAVAVMLIVLVFAQSVLATPEKTPDNRILALKLQKNISLYDLIQTSGYGISDENVVLFLTEFMELNPSVKSVSALKKGTLVRMPIRHLKKTVGSLSLFQEKGEVSGLKLRTARKRTPVRRADHEALHIEKSLLLRNIQSLFTALGEDISLEKEGFKYFALSEKSDISFDAGLFPVMDLHNDRILVIDYMGAFPEEIKNLLEVSWPEYRVVSSRGGIDLRGIVPLLLQESGYLFEDGGKMISGGSAQVEYHTDFLVHGKNGKPMTGDISLVSILGKGEYQTPQEIISWFMNRDIRIIELTEQDRKYANRSPGTAFDMRRNSRGEAFVENLLTLMGFPFSRDKNIDLSPSKEIRFNMRVDLLIDMGFKKKIVDFSGISDQEVKYGQKFGLDIVQIEPWERKKDVLRKIMSLLSLSFTNSPRKNAHLLTPRDTRYRLLLPGFVVHSLKGVFFMTDTDLDEELQKSILSAGISVVKF